MRRHHTAVLLLLIATGMIFSALTSAMYVRRGLGDDWRPLAIPPLALWNLGVLAASSLALQLGKRRAAALLGILFIALQFQVWRELAQAGITVASNPSSSFFYLLTSLHAVHVIGGIAALAALAPAATLYWHAMSALWAYIILLFRWLQ